MTNNRFGLVFNHIINDCLHQIIFRRISLGLNLICAGLQFVHPELNLKLEFYEQIHKNSLI